MGKKIPIDQNCRTKIRKVGPYGREYSEWVGGLSLEDQLYLRKKVEHLTTSKYPPPLPEEFIK